jgi:hypothetical protein
MLTLYDKDVYSCARLGLYLFHLGSLIRVKLILLVDHSTTILRWAERSFIYSRFVG